MDPQDFWTRRRNVWQPNQSNQPHRNIACTWCQLSEIGGVLLSYCDVLRGTRDLSHLSGLEVSITGELEVSWAPIYVIIARSRCASSPWTDKSSEPRQLILCATEGWFDNKVDGTDTAMLIEGFRSFLYPKPVV